MAKETKIKTNQLDKNLISWDDLTKEEKEDFNFIEDHENVKFFRYNGIAYSFFI